MAKGGGRDLGEKNQAGFGAVVVANLKSKKGGEREKKLKAKGLENFGGTREQVRLG